MPGQPLPQDVHPPNWSFATLAVVDMLFSKCELFAISLHVPYPVVGRTPPEFHPGPFLVDTEELPSSDAQ